MKSRQAPIDDTTLELLADEATDTLSPTDRASLDAILVASPEVDRDCLARITALLELHELRTVEAPPAALLSRLRASGDQWLAASRPDGVRELELQVGNPRAARVRARRSSAVWAGWSVAACLAIAWVASVALRGEEQSADQPLESRVSGLATLPGTMSLPWQAGTDTTGKGVSGRVVWNAELQAGYMIFTGLQANDPAKEQYQLWVFDAARDERFPVHGGVFDVPANSAEVIVPIDPRLAIEQIQAFVVTVERPGGVWVSDRSRIAALAAKGG